MFAYVSLGNALPHSSDRNGGGDDGVGTGWERGRNGVGTGESAVGAARLYNLRLPPKASGKDTGLVAGARIEGLPPMPPTPAIWRRRSKVKRCMFQYKQSNGEIGAA